MYVKWISLSLLVIVLGIIGYYSYTFYHFANSIHKKPSNSIFTKPLQLKSTIPGADYSPPKWEGKEQVNILLLGGDSRGLQPNEIPRSDSIMVASINPVTKQAYLFSILRDTYVDIPGRGSDRINAAITMGGPELAMKTTGNLLGIPIQYYVYTDFKGFIALIDAIGGIDIDVEKDMYYVDEEDDHQYDINLKKGPQHMEGKTALQYVRFRHDALSDFTRTERQRKFMTALAGELQSGWSIVRLPKILNAIDPYIETNLAINDMLKLASLAMSTKTSDIVKAQLPPMHLLQEKTVRGAEVIGVDAKKLQSFVRSQLDGTGDGVTQGADRIAGISGDGTAVHSTDVGGTGSLGTSGKAGTGDPGKSGGTDEGAATRAGKASGAATQAGRGSGGAASDNSKNSAVGNKSGSAKPGTAGSGKKSPDVATGPADGENGTKNVGGSSGTEAAPSPPATSASDQANRDIGAKGLTGSGNTVGSSGSTAPITTNGPPAPPKPAGPTISPSAAASTPKPAVQADEPRVG